MIFWKRFCSFFLLFVWLFAFPSFAQTPPGKKPPTKRGLPVGFVPPVLKKFIQAPYPEEEKKARKTGVVIAKLVVSIKGKVIKVTLVQSAGKAFDQAAITALKKFEFVPATYKKKPVPVSILYKYRFVLQAVTRPVSKPSSKSSSKPSSKSSSNPSSGPSSQKRVELKPIKVDKKTMLVGYILEKGTRKRIEGAPVYLIGRKARRQALSDRNGVFRLPRVPSGIYRLVVPVPNYKRFQKVIHVFRTQKKADSTTVATSTIHVSRQKPTTVNFYLTRSGAGAFETVTRGKRKKKEVYRQSLQREEIMILPGTNGDPLKVIQNLPGVARTPMNAGFFIVRGSAPEDSRVYMDGHEIPQLYHFGGLTAVVNGDFAKRLDFIAGNFSAAYGRSTGGIIDLKTRGGSERLHGYLDIDLIDIGFLLEGPLWDGATFMLSARRSHLDVVLNAVLPDTRGFDLTVAPRYYDFQAKLNWKTTSHHRFSFMVYGSDDRLTFLRSAPLGPSGLRGEFSLATAFYRAIFSWLTVEKGIEHEFSVHTGYRFIETNIGGALRFSGTNLLISLRDELRVKFSEKVRLRVGLDSRVSFINVELTLPSTVPASGDAPGSAGGGDPLRQTVSTNDYIWTVSPAAYAEVDWRPISMVRAILGTRVDYYSYLGGFTFDPRFTFLFIPNKKLTLNFGIGLFSQPPQAQEISPDFGNPELGVERAMHYTLGSEYFWTRYFSTRLTLYYKSLSNLITRSNDKVKRGGEEVPKRLDNLGEGSSYGMEVMIRHTPHKRFFGWISYTLGRSVRRDTPDADEHLFNFDQTHILTVLGAYKLGYGLSVSARFRIVSGNPVTPRTGGIFDADTGRYFPIPGKFNSERNPFFHQLDIRLDYQFVFNTWKLMFYLDVQNVYNHANQEGVIYNYDSTKSAPLTGVPIFPSIGVKGQF